MEVFSKTDVGLVRHENQDSASYSVISSNCAWAVICDGMGGARGGKTASTIAVEHISEVINTGYYDAMDSESIADMLIAAVEEANTMIYKMSLEDFDLAGMGTTCDLVFIRNATVHIVHVGDSRTYSIRDGRMLQLTEDHSVVQEMVNRGELTPDEAQHHPNKNFITRAIGVTHEVHIDYIEAEFAYGDVILLCSDGLSNYVDKADIIRIVSENRGDLLIDSLVEEAKRCGGKDNITVTVIY